jgi:small subunit ribosomal protein S4
MGDPKKIRKKYQPTKMMWNTQRIELEHGIKRKYGLKNLRELWKATTEISKIRRNVREALAGRSKQGEKIIARLARYDIVKSNATLDDLLVVNPEAILDRRLQSIVYKKGFAKSPGQARQLITHGFVSIRGKRVSAPGYLVTREEEPGIGMYRPFNLNHNLKPGEAAAAAPAAPVPPPPKPSE